MKSKKIVALITLACFVFSFVLGDSLAAAVVPVTGAPAYEKALNSFVIPYTYGRITGAQPGNGPVVIHIQDLHCHPEAQRNIGRILSLLDEKCGPLHVYTEGAAGNVDTTWLSGIRDGTLKERIADSLLARGKLTGVEYYALSGRPIRITGLEDRALYAANVRRLSGLLAESGSITAVLDGMRSELAALKADHLGTRNRKLERTAAKYREGGIDSGRYLRLLRKYAQKLNIDFAGYASVNEYLELGDLGGQLDYPKTASELHAYVGYLRQALPFASFNLLVTRTGNFTRLDEVYADLAALSKDPALAAVLASRYPHLAKFLRYVAESQRINPVRLLQEENALLRLIRGNLSRNRSEREIVFLDDFFTYLSSYYANKLTADEYAYYRDNVARFNELWSKYADTELLEALEPYRSRFADYYETNLQRNDCFLNAIAADETLAGAKGTGAPNESAEEMLAALAGRQGAVVVISGGFHTDGLAKMLGDRGYAFLTITPNVTGNTASSDAVYDGLIRYQSTFLAQALGAYLLSVYPDSEWGLELMGAAIGAAVTGLGARDGLSVTDVRRIEQKIQNDVLPALQLSRKLAGIRFEMSPGRDNRYPSRLIFTYRGPDEDVTINFDYDLTSRTAVRTDKKAPTAGVPGNEEEGPGETVRPSPSPIPPQIRNMRSAASTRQPVERKLWNLYGKDLLEFSKATVKDFLARYPAQSEQDRLLDRYIEAVLETKEFQRMMFVSQGLQSSNKRDPKRLHHIIEVTKTAAQLAERLNLSVRRAMLLALLHDLGHPVLGHIAEKVNNYGAAGLFTHNYSHNRQGAVIADYLFRGKMPDELLESMKTGISRHSDKANRVEIEENRFGSPEGIILMFSDAISGINTDLRLAVKYGFTTLPEIHEALPELDKFKDYTIDDLADEVIKMLKDDLVRSSDGLSIGFSDETALFYNKVKSFILTNYIGKASHKANDDQWRDCLVQILRRMTVDQQIVFLRSANDADLRKLFKQYHIAFPAGDVTDSYLLADQEESFAVVSPKINLALKAITVATRIGDEIVRATVSPREGIEILRDRAQERNKAKNGNGMMLVPEKSGPGAVNDFAARVQQSAPGELEPATVGILEDFLRRDDLEHLSYFNLSHAVGYIARKRPDLLTLSLLDVLESALSRQKKNESNVVFLAGAIDEIGKVRPDLLQPSMRETLLDALRSQNEISENSISALSGAIAGLAVRPELLDQTVIETLGTTLDRLQVNETVSLRLCNAIGVCVSARGDLAIMALGPLENVLKNGAAGGKLCEHIAEVILTAGAVNPDAISAATFTALESVMTREQLTSNTYKTVSAAIKAIARIKRQLAGKNLLTRVVLSQPDHISWHPLPHYRVYLNAFFDMVTANLPPEDRYSIALSAYRLLMRMRLEINGGSIERAVRFVMEERARTAGCKIFAGGVSVINLLGREEEFGREDIERLERNSGVTRIATFKGAGDFAKTSRIRSGALTWIARTPGPLTIFFGGHGSPDCLWFDSRQTDSKHPDYTQAIGYRELGDALLERGDLRRVNLLVDACSSYDFCVNLLAYLEQKGADDYPILVSSSNLDQASRPNLFKEGLLSMDRPSGVCLKDIFDAEKMAFRYQDGAVFIPADLKTLGMIFSSGAMPALPERGLIIELPVSDLSGLQTQAYHRLPGEVAEIGMIPGLWRGIVAFLQKLSLNGRRLVPDRAIAALGGLEEVFFSGVMVGGVSFLLSLFGIDPNISLAVSSVLSFLVFQAAHLNGNYALSRGRLAVAPPSGAAKVRTALLGGALRLVFAASLAVGIGFPAALAITVAAHGAFNALNGLSWKGGGLMPRRASNALDDGPLSEALRTFVKNSADPRSAVGAVIREETSAGKGMPLNEYSRFLKRLGARAGLAGAAVYYPFGGFDPYTPFSLVPSASDVFSVGLDEFGSVRDLTEFFEQGCAGDKACWRFRQYELDSISASLGVSRGFGALAVARIAVLLKGRITRISYFSVDRDGSLVFAEKGDGGFRNAVVEFTDPSGRTKRFWYFQDNVFDPTTNFARFAERDDFDFRTLLIKGAPAAWDSGSRTEEERALAIRKTLAPALRNHARRPVTVFTDKRNASPRLVEAADGQRPIWRPGYAPDTIRLAGGESFGYSGNGCLYYGPAARLIDGDTPAAQIRNYGAPNDDDEDFFAGSDAYEEPSYYYLRRNAQVDAPWRERFGDDISFSGRAGILTEAVREGALGEFRIKEDMPPETARKYVIEFIGSIQGKIRDMTAEAKRLAENGRHEEAARVFAAVQKMDPFAAIENFDPAAVRIDGDRIITGIGQEENFTDKSLSRKERLAQYEKGILRFARSSGSDTRLGSAMNQFRFSAQNVALIVSSIKTMNRSNWKDKLTKVVVGLLFLGTQVVPPMVVNSFDEATGNIKKMEMFKPSFTVTVLDVLAAVYLASGLWPTAIGFIIGSIVIRLLARGMRAHELTHFYQHLVVHRMHKAGLVSSENKLPLNVFEVTATPIKQDAPSQAQFDRVTTAIVRDALGNETGGMKKDRGLLAVAAKKAKDGLGGFPLMKIISGAAVAGFVNSSHRDLREARTLFPALWDTALYAVSRDLNAAPFRRWLASASAAGIPAAAITLLPPDMPLENLSELGKVLVPVPGRTDMTPAAVYAGTTGGTKGGKAAVLYLALENGETPDGEFLGRASRAVIAELAENPSFRERLKDLYNREELLDGRDIGDFDFTPGAVLLDGDEVLAAAVPAANEDALENPFPGDVMFAYVQPAGTKAGQKGWMNGAKAGRLCDTLLDGRTGVFAALERCQHALEAKRAEGALKGCDVLARVIMGQLLPDDYADDAGIGKLIYLKKEIIKAKALGANNVLLERLFNEEYQSAVHEYLVDWREVPAVSGDPGLAKMADTLTAGGPENEAERTIAGALAGSEDDLRAAARFALANRGVSAYAAARGGDERLRGGFACAQMHAYRQLKDIIDFAHHNGVRLHREFTASGGEDWKTVREEIVFWLNRGIGGSKFDGARVDLSAVKTLTADELEELAARLRQGVLVTVILPENGSPELADTCRALGFKVVRTYVAGTERPQGGAGDNVCAEIHVPAAGLSVDGGKLKALLDGWKNIPADLLSIQLDILEGGTVSEDPFRRNPQWQRSIPAADAGKLLAILKIGAASGRRTAWGLAEKDLPGDAGTLSAMLDLVRAFSAAGDLSKAASCETVFAAAGAAAVKGAAKRSAPVVWQEIEKLSRQGRNEDTPAVKQERAKRLDEFVRGVAERMLLKESRGDVRFEDGSLDGEFARLLLKGELAFAGHRDGKGIAAGVPDSGCLQLLRHLIVLRRHAEARGVVMTLASRYAAVMNAPGFKADRQWLETALQWVAVLERYAGKSGSGAFLREYAPGSRMTVLAVAEKVLRAAPVQPGLQAHRYNALWAMAAMTGDKAFATEARALENEALAAAPGTAAEKAAYLDATAESGVPGREEIGARTLAGIRLLAGQAVEPEAIAATEWALDLHADRKFPQLKMQDVVLPAINTLSVAGIRSAA